MIHRLQIFSHLEFLRETFRQMGSSNEHNKPQGSSVLFNRQTTVECFQVCYHTIMLLFSLLLFSIYLVNQLLLIILQD